MHVAPPTPDESDRIAELRSLAILDTDPGPSWQRVVSLASRLCRMPIALVSLVDERRQWFKARVGLDATETHRDYAFCAHAIHAKEILEVRDASHDERFHDNPLVAGPPYIRFYAGLPVRGPQGHNLGTVCVIDRRPRRLTAGQRDSLTMLGNLVEELLAVRSAALTLADVIEDVDETIAHNQEAQDQWLTSRRQAIVNTFAHELSTPLTPLILQMQSLAESLQDRPEDLERLDMVQRNIDRLHTAAKSAVSALQQEP